jgi:formate dehydrogenase major subunit
MGHRARFAFDSAAAVWDEVRDVWPDGAGMTYARLDSGGLQWPCRDTNDPGTTILHATRFASQTTAALRRIDYVPSPETADAAFPFLLTTGRTLYQFSAGTMTGRTPNRELRPTDTLDLSGSDAERLGIHDGDLIRVRSRYGAAVLPARIAPTMSAGCVFATFHDPQVFLNRVTGPHRDRLVGAPEYKVTAVALDKAG